MLRSQSDSLPAPPSAGAVDESSLLALVADRLMYTSKQDGKGRLTLRPIDARVDEAPSSEA